MISLTELEAYLQEESLFNEILSEDSYEGMPILSYETNQRIFGLSIDTTDDSIYLIFVDYESGLESRIKVVEDENDLADIGQEIASAFLWLLNNSRLPTGSRNAIKEWLAELEHAGIDPDLDFEPNF